MAPQGSLPLSRPHWSSAFWDDVKNVTWDARSVILQHLTIPNRAIEAGGLFTREGVVREVADKGLLVEDRSVAAEEAPLGGAGHDAVVVLDGQADVEDLKEWFGQNISNRFHKS